MKALTWQGRRKVGYGEVPDPRIEEPTDAVIKVASSGISGSDLHLYEVMGPFLDAGDVLRHEVIGVVEETGSAVPDLSVATLSPEEVIAILVALGGEYGHLATPSAEFSLPKDTHHTAVLNRLQAAGCLAKVTPRRGKNPAITIKVA